MIKDIKLSKLLELFELKLLELFEFELQLLRYDFKNSMPKPKLISLDSNFNLIETKTGESFINTISISYFTFVCNKDFKHINIIKIKDIINLIIDIDEVWTINCSEPIILSNCRLLSSQLPIEGPIVKNKNIIVSVTCGIEDFVIIDKKILTKDQFMIKEIIE